MAHPGFSRAALFVLIVGACATTPTPPASPTGMASASTAADASATPVAPRSPGSSMIQLACGLPDAPIDVKTCLAGLAAAAQALTEGTVTSATLSGPTPSGGWPPALVSTFGDATVEVQDVPTLTYEATFESTTGAHTIPLYIGASSDAGEWGLGPPPSDGRRWSVTGDLGTWSDPRPLVLQAFIYEFQVSCSGAGVAGGATGSGTAVIELLGSDGSSTKVGELSCGPVGTADVRITRLDMAAGRYDLTLDGVRNALTAQLLPVATWR